MICVQVKAHSLQTLNKRRYRTHSFKLDACLKTLITATTMSKELRYFNWTLLMSYHIRNFHDYSWKKSYSTQNITSMSMLKFMYSLWGTLQKSIRQNFIISFALLLLPVECCFSSHWLSVSFFVSSFDFNLGSYLYTFRCRSVSYFTWCSSNSLTAKKYFDWILQK